MLLLLDVLDNLGHVVLVLLFGLFERHGFLFGDIGPVGFELGIELIGADGLEFLLDGRRGSRPARLQKGLGVEGSAAFRADHRLAHQIVVTGPATRTNPLGAPFGFRHYLLHGEVQQISSARHCHRGRTLSKANFRR